MKVLFISLGCDKNLVDSEHMSGILSKAGYEFTDDEREADRQRGEGSADAQPSGGYQSVPVFRQQQAVLHV